MRKRLRGPPRRRYPSLNLHFHQLPCNRFLRRYRHRHLVSAPPTHQPFLPAVWALRAPLWTHFQHLAHPRKNQDWIDYDNELISRCDVCLRMAAAVGVQGGGVYYQNDSLGADDEVAFFLRLGKPVFYSFTELGAWLKDR